MRVSIGRSGWPCLALVVFFISGPGLLLPPGYGRAVVVAPVFLAVPGALTLGAVAAGRFQRLTGVEAGLLAALLSVVWPAFASLALTAAGIRITAVSTYLCLLVICAVLAAVAQIRLRRLGQLSAGTGGRSAVYCLVALAMGTALLTGGTYAYAGVPHPAPAGFTWIAWTGTPGATGTPGTGTIAVGPAGTRLPFQIVHHEPTQGTYRLAATWSGLTGRQELTGAGHALAKPVTMRIGPGETVDGTLAVPAPPGGRTFRLVVTLTAVGTSTPGTWSVNADVRR